MLICGAFAAADTVEEVWFLSKALGVARLLNIGNYNELGEAMGQCFYSSKLQHESMCKLTSRILDQEGKSPSSHKDQTLEANRMSGNAFATTLVPCQEGYLFGREIGVCIYKSIVIPCG